MFLHYGDFFCDLLASLEAESPSQEADLDNERLIQPGALMLAARGPEGCEVRGS